MICPKCGHEAAGNFCSYCGASLLTGNREGAAGGNKPAPNSESAGVEEYEAALSRRLSEERERWETEPLQEKHMEPEYPSSRVVGQDTDGTDLNPKGTDVQRAGQAARRTEEKAAQRAAQRTEEKATQRAEKKTEEEAAQRAGQRAEEKGAQRSEKRSGKRTEQKSEKKTEQKKEQKADQKSRLRLEERLAALEEEKKQREQADIRKAKEEKKQKRLEDAKYMQDMRDERKQSRFEDSDQVREEQRQRRQRGQGMPAGLRRETEEEFSEISESVEELKSRERRRRAREEQEKAADGVLGVVVLLARIMQIVCFFLMAGMVWASARSFWYGRKELGSVRTLMEDGNVSLAFYLLFAVAALGMGILWCLWILSRKAAGGGVRLKKYDTGRGLIPFLLCLAAVLAAGPASMILGAIPGAAEAMHGLYDGVQAVLEAINSNHDYFVFSCAAGAILSVIRRLLQV